MSRNRKRRAQSNPDILIDEGDSPNVLGLIRDGYSDGEIARRLKVNPTVIANIRELYRSRGLA